MSFCRPWILAALLLSLFSSFPSSLADQTITYYESDGQPVYLDDDRKPALYTETFGSCLPSSDAAISIDRFDAALYMDNMTVVFHIIGNTQLIQSSVMVYLGVYAYGEDRFEISWNPCGTEITSLCPVQSTVPIQASGIIPLGQPDVDNIPSVAFNIPDFEGQVILRIFSNTTQTEIACYAAAVTNGATFNQQNSVGVILGFFALVALISSMATAAYGQNIPEMRTHYAHSLSILVVFAVFHHIFFTGALSMNWPSVLVGFWANYAWSAGMISVPSMQNAISKFTGNFGSTLDVGAATTGGNSSDVAGGYDIHTIYRRQYSTPRLLGRFTQPARWMGSVGPLYKRELPSTATGFKWYGPQIGAGLPLPGNFSGFAGTLSEELIPASNALLTGLVWFFVLLLFMSISISFFKLALEVIARRNAIRTERFEVFRANWKRYIVFALLRGCYISFFMIMFLTIFQFTYNGRPGVLAVAALTFVVFFLGMFGIAGYACYTRFRHGTWSIEKDRIYFKKITVLRAVPWWTLRLGHNVDDSEKALEASFPCWRIQYLPAASEIPVHLDVKYMLQFGWLASRFRLSRWWFFAAWLFYEFARACFFAGASGYPLVQVFCLLVLEFAAFIVIVKLRPFEGQRLNIVMVYLLGFSKVLTVALSAAFDVRFNIDRIAATVVGFIIIIIQLLLTIALIICIVLGAISSYFSITRHREAIKPRVFMPWRQKYFAHITQAALDQPQDDSSPTVVEKVEPPTPSGPYFSVKAVKRLAKIEDEDAEFQKDILSDPRSTVDKNLSDIGFASPGYFAGPSAADGKRISHRASISHSLSSQMSHSSLPFAAALYRGNWTTKGYAEYQAERDPLADRVQRDGWLSPENSETALSPQLRHLTSRDNFPDFSRPESSRESSWMLKRPPSQQITTTKVERHESTSSTGSSSNTSDVVESTTNTQSRAKSPLSHMDLVDASPPPS